ncbi:DUF3406 domain protein [Medicago truncatula]|uniref:DUF3406 domain protein n=1 Tax=Medicago truncatula TaxID=3880 RepID=G7IKY2_MEDTR|nr:DUF3406 domain protein [Medicago truncatula]
MVAETCFCWVNSVDGGWTGFRVGGFKPRPSHKKNKWILNDIFRWGSEAHCRSLGFLLWIWHIGCNLQSQISIGQYTNLEAQANLNNRGTRQIN